MEGRLNSLPFLWVNLGENMKRIILLLLNVCFVLTLTNLCFAGRFEKSGEYYRYFEDNGSVARDQIIEYDRKLYYVNDEGYAVFNSWVEVGSDMYYAGNDGVFKTDGVYEIEGYKYYLDKTGKLQKGWCGEDYLYYGDLEDGFLINGFQELDIPRDWATEVDKEKTGWFYFDTNTYKRVFSEDEPYISKMVGNRRYCFDQNGIMRTGWRHMKETEPVMKGWMYFVEDTSDEFKFGEAVTDTWYSVEPPTEVLPGADVRYFYFNGQGQPRTAPVGKYQKVRLGEKTYLFNEYGYAVYGIQEVSGDYYYFGPDVTDCSMKTGYINRDIDGSNDGSSFYFEGDGKGVTGVYQNKLYYKGKLQKASAEQKYAGFEISGRVYLVNASGTILKNRKKVKDGDGSAWSTNSSGIVTYHDEDADYTTPSAPELSIDR